MDANLVSQPVEKVTHITMLAIGNMEEVEKQETVQVNAPRKHQSVANY